MFAAQSPWERAYIRMNEVDSINTLGGPSGEDRLVFDEEVVVLSGRAQGAMSVSGTDGQHVLRLDGTCATVMSEELTSRRPPAPRYATAYWPHLDSDLQEALLEDAGVKNARRAQRDTCRGSWSMNAGAPCKLARERLANAIVKAIKRPIALPDVKIRTL